MKPMLKAPGLMLLKLRYDGPLSNFAFKFNLCSYNADDTQDIAELDAAAHTSPTHFSTLALLAHVLNEKVVAHLQVAAKAHLRNDEWGAQLAALKPIDTGEAGAYTRPLVGST